MLDFLTDGLFWLVLAIAAFVVLFIGMAGRDG